MTAAPAADQWLTVTVPAFMADNPVYADNPTLALLLDALVRAHEEKAPDITLDAALLRATHEILVSHARLLIAAMEPLE
ncbi:hypothetical protein ABE527_18455 [Brucella sp. TWI432]